MEEFKCRHKSIQSAAHHIALECIHPQDARAYSTPSDSPILGRALCLTPKGSPVPGRVSHLSDKFQDSVTLTSNTDALVSKISAMFPTVSETHIKILLKKYYNREAVVISALQVEKHPITTPGPLSMSPSASRLQRSAMGVYTAVQLAKGSSMHGSSHLTPLSGTPHVSRSGSPSFLRPASGASSYYGTNKSIDGGHSTKSHSPKMKLKYLKSIFPKAEETLILDVLANKDNNVQKASEELLTMGFPKKEKVLSNSPPKKKERDTPQPVKKMVTIMMTSEDKELVKSKLQKKYIGVPERVIGIALDSVDYNEERAEQILSTMLKEDVAEKPAASADMPPDRPSDLPPTRPILKTSSSIESKYKSQYTTSNVGPNPEIYKGPQDKILLEDYITWKGPNPELRCGKAVHPIGPESKDRPLSRAKGPASGLAKGPAGLAKGSIYQKLTKKTAKMCVH